MTLATGTTVGYIAAGAFTGALKGAVIGAATDALITGSLAALKGKPKEQIFKESIEAAANGFMIGAITGAISGGFKSYTQLQKSLATYSDDIIKKLPAKNRQSLINYTQEGGFGSAEEVNGLLRSGNMNENVKLLDQTFAKAKLPQSAKVFRGSNGFIGDIPVQEVNGKINLNIGQSLTDTGYLSTSMNKAVANNFGSGRGAGVKIVEELTTSRGASGLYLDSFSKCPGEAELLLNRGTSRIIVDIYKVNDVWHVVTTMI